MKFRRVRRRLFRDRFEILVKVILPIVVGIAIFADAMKHPETAKWTFAIRAALLVLAHQLLRLQKSTWILRHAHTLPMMALNALMVTSICSVGLLNGDAADVYLIRLNMVAIFSFCLMPWRLRGLLTSFAIIYGPFAAICFLSEAVALNWNEQLTAASTALSIVMIGYLVNLLTVRDLMRNFEERLSLFRGVLQKETVIAEKSRESLQLERLTTQFSPQVLDEIKNGNLSVASRDRREVTSIFIDIENSSYRSQLLGYQAYEAVLSEFFTVVTSVLIKHNITIGTYLGDGILAFANAPILRTDHQVAAAEACLEILVKTEKLRKHFSEMWRAEFNIRIGINAGAATVGFFPNSQFGTYTALGESVNLASRLCASASPNSICVSKDFLKHVAGNLRDVRAESHGNIKDFKGYQTESLEIFVIQSAFHSAAHDDCPRCFAKLILKADLDTCELIQCDACGFSDVRDKESTNEKAADIASAA